MSRAKSVGWRLLILVATIVAAVVGAAVAHGRVADDTILNQTKTQDAIGDSSGPDLSSLTVTTYGDGTISLAVQFANRNLLAPGESVQVNIDLNDDGTVDLNMALWPTGVESYLSKWNGSDFDVVRQLPELVQTDGSFSIRLALSALRDAAGVPFGSRIGLVVGAWTTDPATGTLRSSPADFLSGPGSTWIQYLIARPAPASPPPPTQTTPGATPPAAGHSSPSLGLVCVRRVLHATVTPAKGSKVTSVRFYANGKLKSTDTKAPYVGSFTTGGLHAPLTISATISQSGKTQTVRKSTNPC
jgi:hypothetical protein